MRITSVKTVLLTGPYSAGPYILACRPRRRAAFVEIKADAGIGGISERQLRAMQPGAFRLNPKREPLVQEAAPLRALEEHWTAGAALDSQFHYRMPPDHPLWRMPNVIMTPHMSGTEMGPPFVDRMWDIVMHNVTALLAGGPLWNELSPEELQCT